MTSKCSAGKHEQTEENMASDDFTEAVGYTETDRDERTFFNTKLTPVKTFRDTCIKTRSDDSDPFISGLCFVSNRQIILCDEPNSKLKLFDEVSGNVRFEIRCESPPHDVAVVDDTKVVVSMPSSAKVQFVDIKPGVKLQEDIDVKGKCYGVAVYKDDIYVCIYVVWTHDHIVGFVTSRLIYVCITNQDSSDLSTATNVSSFCGIKILSLAGDVKHSIQHKGPGTPSYLSLNKDGTKIYYSGGTERRAFLSCITKEGHGLFTYSEEILQNPRNLLVDKEENIIFVDCKTNKLHVIDSSCRSQCLLTKKNKPYKMTSICFDRNRGVLGVACSADIYGYSGKPESLMSKLKIYKLEDQAIGRRMSFIRSVFRRN